LPELRAFAFGLADAGELNSFGVEHDALFSGLRFPSLELWESCYVSENGGNKNKRLLNSVTRDVAATYREAGLGVDEAFGQPPDHIGVECAFFAWIYGSSPNAHRRRPFFFRHLRPFIDLFSEALEGRARHPFHKSLAHLLRKSAMLLEEDLKRQNSAAPCSQLPPGIRFLTAEETRERGKERLVPICGINNCGGRCPLLAKVADGCLLEVLPLRESEEDVPPFSHRLFPCSRGYGYPRTFLSGERLRYPMKRTGARGEGRFDRISWDQALDMVAEENNRIKARYGPGSRYVNYAFGVNAVARGADFAPRLLALDGGFLDRYNSYSTACTAFTTPYTYGTTETGNCAADLLNSKLIILWGHNPLETVFGSSVRHYLLEAKKKGIEIIAVDPRFSDSAKVLASRWIGIRPTTDSAMMDGMAFTILSEGLQDQAFMDRCCLGFDRAHMPSGMEDCESYGDYVYGRSDGVPKNPEWAAGITGVDAGTIQWLARKYAAAKPAALLQGYGPQRNGNGEQTVRSGTMLACLTGNVGVPGGSACGAGWVRLHKAPAVAASVKNPYPGKIPSFLWTDAVLRGSQMTGLDGVVGVRRLESNVKMIFNLAGNALINQHSDVNRTAKILEDTSLCEFIVCSDLFLTPSAKFADVLLPGTSMFEGENIGKPWHEGDYILYCNQSVAPLFQCRFEYDWLADLARRLGHYEAFTRGGKNLREILKESYDAILDNEKGMPDFEKFRKKGIYRYRETSYFIAFESNARDPERCPFPTPSGKIEIFSPRLHAKKQPLEIPPIPKYVPSFEGPGDPLFARYPFQLIGWHTKRRCHSIHDNNPDMDCLEPHKIWIHPMDAQRKSILEGDWVEVFNDRGRMRIRAHVTERIVQGVLAVSQGAWHEADERGVDARGCINTLTTSRPTPLAKGNPQHSNLVDMELWVGEGG
jgi:anaerobic dimethyl sulfoxide reductase subunit A